MNKIIIGVTAATVTGLLATGGFLWRKRRQDQAEATRQGYANVKEMREAEAAHA